MSETQELEAYLLKTLPPQDRLVMQARLLLDKELHEKAYRQKQTYTLVQQYGRKLLKAEIEAVHAKMFSENKFEAFRQKISSIFKRKL